MKRNHSAGWGIQNSKLENKDRPTVKGKTICNGFVFMISTDNLEFGFMYGILNFKKKFFMRKKYF